MHRLPSAQGVDANDAYRTIEATLLESARGRWFLAEHGRRARRLDSALLEDAIGRLQTSLRQPPALLDQLHGEVTALKRHIAALRDSLLARPAAAPDATGSASCDAPAHSILKTSEELHEIAWRLQANPFDPQGCEAIARHAAALYTLAQHQSQHAERTLAVTTALADAIGRTNAMLDTIRHERTVDAARA